MVALKVLLKEERVGVQSPAYEEIQSEKVPRYPATTLRREAVEFQASLGFHTTKKSDMLVLN